MASLSDYNLCGNVKFTAFLKNFTFIFLTRTCLTYFDMGTFSKSIENKYEHYKILNINFNRLLAKYEQQRESGYSKMREKLTDHSVVGKKKIIVDQISTNSQLSGKKLNYIDDYMKDYEKRYRKKKGISKLDCYCEKKVFDKFLYIKKLSEKVHNDKKRFRKIFLRKYGIGLILFSLIPALGFIYYIIFGDEDSGLKGLFTFCSNAQHTEPSNSSLCDQWHKFELKDQMEYMKLFNAIFSFTMITIIFVFLIYVIIKLIKYEKLKAGKGKMNIMEYCRFCKDVII